MKPWELWDLIREVTQQRSHQAAQTSRKVLFEGRFQDHKSLSSAAWNASGLRTSATAPDYAREASTGSV